MTGAVLERPAERARLDGRKPSAALAVIKAEAKRAAWLYPLCYAIGVIGTVMVLAIDLPR